VECMQLGLICAEKEVFPDLFFSVKRALL